MNGVLAVIGNTIAELRARVEQLEDQNRFLQEALATPPPATDAE